MSHVTVGGDYSSQARVLWKMKKMLLLRECSCTLSLEERCLIGSFEADIKVITIME